MPVSQSVLYISYDGMTDPLGQSQVIPYLAYLAKKGYNITILSCEKTQNFTQKREYIAKLLNSMKIQWDPIPYTASPPVLSTIKDIHMLKKKACQIIQKNNCKLIHCRSYISALIGLYAKRKFDVPFIFDMRGFWADERVDGNIWSLNNPIFKLIYSYFKQKEIQFLKKAEYTISLTQAGKQELLSWKKIANHAIKIEVIPCCADLHHFDYHRINTEQKATLKRELGIPNDAKIISYLGSVGTWYMLSEMLDFFKEFLDRHPDAIFFFISGDSKKTILNEAKKKGISEESVIVKKADREDVPQYISISTASLFFIKPVYSKKASSPTKMGEVMGLGVPVLCNAGVGDVACIVDETMCGIAIDQCNTIEYSKIINKFAQIISVPKEQIREGAEKYYSLEIGAEKYAQIYKNILQ